VRRTGIDLSRGRCIVVDASTTSRWRKHGERSLLRIHHFITLRRPINGGADVLTTELKSLADSGTYSRHAWVTLWDIRSSHKYIRVPTERLKDAEGIAREHGATVLAPSGVDTREISVAVFNGQSSRERPHERELSFFAAASKDIRAGLNAIRDAGFIVDGVCTPCGALWAQARLRRSATPGAVHAYVAIGVSTSALIIVSDGLLLYAKDLPRSDRSPRR
jgi:Tfp pilus assembly PilM family ATPase